MPKERGSNRNEAFELYKQSNGTMPLVDIANAVGATDGTVRGWKSKDKWEQQLNGTFPKKNTERSVKKETKKTEQEKKSSSKSSKKNKVPIMGTTEITETNTKQKTRGAPKGNNNAKGNRGGAGAPLKNKYALATGEYETISMSDVFDEVELQLMDMETDIYAELENELKYWTIRERRMLKRIKKIEDQKNEFTISSITTTENKTTSDNFQGITKGKSTFLKNNLDDILRIEEALTRVQANKLKVIEKLHKLDHDDERLQMEKERLELYKKKLTGVIDYDELLLDDLEEFEI